MVFLPTKEDLHTSQTMFWCFENSLSGNQQSFECFGEKQQFIPNERGEFFFTVPPLITSFVFGLAPEDRFIIPAYDYGGLSSSGIGFFASIKS